MQLLPRLLHFFSKQIFDSIPLHSQSVTARETACEMNFAVKYAIRAICSNWRNIYIYIHVALNLTFRLPAGAVRPCTRRCRRSLQTLGVLSRVHSLFKTNKDKCIEARQNNFEFLLWKKKQPTRYLAQDNFQGTAFGSRKSNTCRTFILSKMLLNYAGFWHLWL